MRIFSLLALIIICSISQYALAEEIIFSGAVNHKKIELSDKTPKAYIPQRLYIGEVMSVLIKAEPYSNVAVATSNSNIGASDFMGIALRLGEDINTFERIIPKNGVLKIDVNIPNDEDLKGKLKFFEVLVWKDKDFKDIKKAKIISYNGEEAKDNKLIYDFPPKEKMLPGLVPAIPGGPPELLQTMRYLEDAEHNDLGDEIYNMDSYNSKSVIIRNLRSVDMQKNK